MTEDVVDDGVTDVDQRWKLTPEQRARLNQNQSRFEVFFDAPYAEIKAVMTDNIPPGSKVIDLGANQGNLEDYLEMRKNGSSVQCVDIDHEALNKLKEKQYKSINVTTIESDANDYINNYEASGDQDVVLINATLHEINSPADQRRYLQHLFEKVSAILGPSGILIIGDYYYPDMVSDEEVERFIEYQRKAINHADARNKFVSPDLINEVAESSGFEVQTRREIRAVKEIDRRFYVIVLKRKETAR